ncbi:hypothetical protein GCM10027280_26000 [Micromonospora polyrhachis]
MLGVPLDPDVSGGERVSQGGGVEDVGESRRRGAYGGGHGCAFRQDGKSTGSPLKGDPVADKGRGIPEGRVRLAVTGPGVQSDFAAPDGAWHTGQSARVPVHARLRHASGSSRGLRCGEGDPATVNERTEAT